MSTGRRYSDRCDGVSALMMAVYQCRLIDISSQYNDDDDITLLHGVLSPIYYCSSYNLLT